MNEFLNFAELQNDIQHLTIGFICYYNIIITIIIYKKQDAGAKNSILKKEKLWTVSQNSVHC